MQFFASRGFQLDRSWRTLSPVTPSEPPILNLETTQVWSLIGQPGPGKPADVLAGKIKSLISRLTAELATWIETSLTLEPIRSRPESLKLLKILNLQVFVEIYVIDETKPFYSLAAISGWKQNKLGLFQQRFPGLICAPPTATWARISGRFICGTAPAEQRSWSVALQNGTDWLQVSQRKPSDSFISLKYTVDFDVMAISLEGVSG